MKTLNYLFYKFYRVAKKMDLSRMEIPEWYAIMNISIIVSVYLLAILWGYRLIRHQIVYPMSAILAILFFVNYLLFVRKKKYLEIIKMFEDEPKKERVIGDIAIALFTFCAFALAVIARELTK